MNLNKIINLSEKYKLKTLRELNVFITIINHEGKYPLTIGLIEKELSYDYKTIQKIIYKLGSGIESGYPGYKLITYLESIETPGRAKVVKLTKRGVKFSEKIINIIN